MGSKQNLLCGVAMAALSTSGAFAADIDFTGSPKALPAVSGINGKLSGSGGVVDGDGRGTAIGTITVPLGFDFGAQIDGAIGGFDGNTSGGIAGHLFTRDPASYLFGAAAMFQAIGSNEIFRIGPEVEIYLDQFTVAAIAGYEDADIGGGDFYFSGDLSFYLDDNLKISAGYSRSLGIDVAQFGLEWMPNVDFFLPVSVFSQVQVGEGNFESVWAGIRIYFSGDRDKSLIRRHREDDPPDRFQQLERPGEEDLPPPPIVDGVMKL